MDLTPDLNLGKVLNNVIDVIDDIDIIDVIDDINLFDALDDLNLIDGLGNLFDRLGDRIDDIDLDRFNGSDIIKGGIDNDIVRAVVGSNVILGLAGNDTLIGLVTDNLLNGGAGRDRIKALGGDDILTGLVGNDFLDGGRGDDILSGGKGLDELIGGRGDDTFILERNSGRDIITDFDNEDDRLQLLDDLDFNKIGITQRKEDTFISYDNKTIAILKNIDADKITSSDFVQG